jgi:YebC/PmpR family DNA-binding regulatory protein
MSGHSKWHSIRHKKAAVDAKRGKIFTKLIKELTISARLGGGDPEANPRLRLAIARAKSANMPADNVERAIKKGTGELEGVSYEEFTYEGYGPEGVAIIMDIMTDNKNRTAAEIRKLLSKHGGNLGETGCVAWNFEKKSVYTIDAEGKSEDDMLELVMEAGADDLEMNDGECVVYAAYEDYEEILNALQDKGLNITSSETTRVPKNLAKVDEQKAEKIMTLLEALEEHDDVQSVASNMDF